MCRSADDPSAQGGPEYEYEKWVAAGYEAQSESEYDDWVERCREDDNQEAYERDTMDERANAGREGTE